MQVDIRQPNIHGTDSEKISQLYSYLFQLREQLQWAFENIQATGNGSGGEGGTTIISNNTQNITKPSYPETEEEKKKTFEAIEDLIIKSADIYQSYSDRITSDLSSAFVAQSIFGTFSESIKTTIDQQADKISINTDRVTKISDVYRDGENYAVIIKENGYIKAGYLNNYTLEGDENSIFPEYGIEIGYKGKAEGTEISSEEKSVGRFTSKEVVLFDPNGNRGAWLSANMLHTGKIEVEKEMKFGDFRDVVDPLTRSVTTYWIGEMEE